VRGGLGSQAAERPGEPERGRTADPMHELAITESVVAAISDRVGRSRVVRLRLEIGRLSGVVADSVRFCFDVCAAGTPLEGATLEIVETPGRALCRDCREETAVDDGILLCACGGANLELLGGTELRIDEVEVRNGEVT
jgi:hydrogenase nickel incorporation protein HypA/HybF